MDAIAASAEAGERSESQVESDRAELGRWYRIELPEGADFEATLDSLNALDEVALAEPNYEWHASYEIPPVIEGLPDGTTDPGYDEQWFHKNAWIWKAWDYLNHNGVYAGGTHDVVVAVIDTGVDYAHEELAANAFLSKYWDPNVSHWMRIVSKTGNADHYATLLNNYWGTDSTTLIDHAIVGCYDNFTTARIDYGKPPTHGYESTYPFVEGVLINGVSAENVPELGAGRAVFTVTFNRDMDPSVQPFTTFGPSAPYTDFSVHPAGTNELGPTRSTAEERTTAI
jgi:hypothetical protein